MLTVLRLRSWLGWGEHPDALRAHSRTLLRIFSRLLLGLIIINGVGVSLFLIALVSNHQVVTLTSVRHAAILGLELLEF